jgi:hypothetical protein
METKKVKLDSGFQAKIKEMSVDDIDYCSDIPEIKFDENNVATTIKYMAKARTAWLRYGVDGCNDAMLKSMTDEDKAELMLKVQEFQKLGEGKPSD